MDAYINLKGLSHFGIDCLQMDRVLPFYRDGFNMTVVDVRANGNEVWLSCENGHMLCLTQVGQLTPMPCRTAKLEGRRQVGSSHAALVVHPNQYLEAIERMKQRGVEGRYFGNRPYDPAKLKPTDPWHLDDPEGYGMHFQCGKDSPGQAPAEVRIREIDHYTYEVGDIEAVERFYQEVLELPMHVQLGLDGRQSRHTFHTLTDAEGREHHIGFFLDPSLRGLRDPHAPWYSPQYWAFEVAADDFDPARRKLENLEIDYLGPTEHAADWPVARSIRFSDADGFSLEIAVRR